MRLLSKGGFASAEEYAVYSKIAARLLPYLLLLYIVAFLDRINVSFAKLSMAADIGLSDTAYGLGAGIFFIAFCIFEIPSNLLLQRFGARFWIARIMVTWGLICAAMAWISTPMHFYILRFMLGFAEAGFYPGIILYLTYWFPSRLRGQATAVFVVGIALAGVIGAPACGWIMSHMQTFSLFRDWQWLFLLTGMPAILLGVSTYFYLQDSPQDAHWLNDAEKRFVTEDLARDPANHREHHRLSDAFSNLWVWVLALINFTIVISLYGVSFWLPQIVKNLGVDNTFYNGLLVAIPSLLAAITMVLVARHSDRTLERRWHVVGCAIVATIGLLLAAIYPGQAYVSLFGLSLAMMGVLSGFSMLWTVPPLLLSGTAIAAGIALITTVGNFGGYAGPYLVGYVKQVTGHLEYALYCLAALSLLGAIATALLPVLRQPETASREWVTAPSRQ
ncbi:MFS transporter (plasmid) [Paraburkholderia sp. PREW-6R]|uniref:MFS transporter n=1 Tax=Paraburkholderia sp. PREW-6R TaxID=3141544 RepID=UPI0031F48BFE